MISPAESSEEAPAESSVEESAEDSVPPTGDAGLVVFAILAVLAVAGIVLAKKRA